MIRVFIGYDPREAVAYSVLAYSIHARASVPVAIAPLMLSELRGLLIPRVNATRCSLRIFRFPRFLTPHLIRIYAGWSIFMDCDMLVLDDIAKLHALCDERYAVMVVKHDHVPNEVEEVSRPAANLLSEKTGRA